MPEAAREIRRAEIESDLWESEQDSSEAGDVRSAAHVLARLLVGIPDDLGWRMDHAPLVERRLEKTVAATAAAAAIAALWLFASLGRVNLPAPPVPASLTDVRLAPPPPPPPPPPPSASPPR